MRRGHRRRGRDRCRPGAVPSEIDELREGRGIGLARAAELNGYPGPRHVLDAADAGLLALRPGQRAAVTGVLERMAAEARRLGARILDEERGLEAVFRAGAVTAADLEARSARLGALRADLRLVHLRAHLELRPLLDAEQVARYYRLRGHAGGDAHH